MLLRQATHTHTHTHTRAIHTHTHTYREKVTSRVHTHHTRYLSCAWDSASTPPRADGVKCSHFKTGSIIKQQRTVLLRGRNTLCTAWPANHTFGASRLVPVYPCS